MMVPKNNNNNVSPSNHRSLSTASSDEDVGGDFSEVQWTASSRSGDDGVAVAAGADRQEGWEMLPPTQVSFALEEEKEENPHDDSYDQCNTEVDGNAFHHSRSIPDLRRYSFSLCDDALEEECSGVMVAQQQLDDSTIGSSSVVIVPRINCSSSTGSSNPWASKLSFKDAILQKSSAPSAQVDHAVAGDSKLSKPTTPQRKLPGVRFQVVETKKPTIRRGFQSMPNLHCFEENVLGETDANPYYDQKSAGAIGRANGSKLRPDEKKRRQMILNKKNIQRQQQQQQQRQKC